MPPAKSPMPYSRAAARPRITVTIDLIQGSEGLIPRSARLGYAELGDVEIPGAEPGLGVREVQRPHAAERLVETERGHGGRLLLERDPPPVQRLRVVPAEAELVGDPQRRVRGERSLDRLDRGALPAREDVLPDPGVRVLRGPDRAVV